MKQSAVVNAYNTHIGGIDLLDRVIGKCAMRYRTNKWTIQAIDRFVDFGVVCSCMVTVLKRCETATLDFKFVMVKCLLEHFAKAACKHVKSPAVKVGQMQPPALFQFPPKSLEIHSLL